MCYPDRDEESNAEDASGRALRPGCPTSSVRFLVRFALERMSRSPGISLPCQGGNPMWKTSSFVSFVLLLCLLSISVISCPTPPYPYGDDDDGDDDDDDDDGSDDDGSDDDASDDDASDDDVSDDDAGDDDTVQTYTDCDGVEFQNDDCIDTWGYPCLDGVGDGVCDDGTGAWTPALNFNCAAYNYDGGDCDTPSCGDGTCNGGETTCSCPADCGTCSGCCSGATCESGTSDTACGSGGNTCQNCVNQGLTCQNQTCQQNCVSHSYYECYNGDIWWYDSCGSIEDMKEACAYGCTNGSLTCDQGPVTILLTPVKDATITNGIGYMSGAGGTNYDTSWLEVGCSYFDANNWGVSWTLLDFDFKSQIPANATIIDAAFRYHVDSAVGSSFTGYYAQLTSNWSEGSVTWNSMPSYYPQGGSFSSPTPGYSGWATKDWTTYVQHVIDEYWTSSYYGTLITSPSDQCVNGDMYIFHDKEYWQGVPPELEIEYQP